MSGDDYSVVALEESPRIFVKSIKAEESNRYTRKKKKVFHRNRDGENQKSILFRRLPSLQSSLNPFRKLRSSFRKLNCFKGHEEDEEELPMMEVPRHKSIDIGVGLARRVSLFLFTKRTVCVHPYHPFTPEQTTRKIHIFSDD